MLKKVIALTLFYALITLAVAAHAQQGQWAGPNDPTAKYMIDAERQWAESGCTHNKIEQKILADDFQGTAPDGKRYTKAEEVQSDVTDKDRRECRLDNAKVKFFGDNIAIVYGSERSIMKSKDGTEYSRCLVWTDTWLKRNTKWQIVAAQDTRVECRQR